MRPAQEAVMKQLGIKVIQAPRQAHSAGAGGQERSPRSLSFRAATELTAIKTILQL